jgi:hypothetical protein
MIYRSKKISIRLFLVLFLGFYLVPYFKVSSQTCNPNTLKPAKYGQKGTVVKNLQSCLIEAGYNIPGGATGYYGKQTRNAVKKFYADWYGAWGGNRFGTKGVIKLKEKLLAKTKNLNIDCGTSIDCLISASKTCSPAKATYDLTLNLFGVTTTNTLLLEIKGKEADKCILYLRREKIESEFPSSVPQTIVDEQKAIYKKLEGRDGTCKFNPDDLTAMLTRWKEGIFKIGTVSCKLKFSESVCKTEGGDFGVAECKGKYFEQFTQEEIEEIFGKRIPANTSVKIDLFQCPDEAERLLVQEDGTACFENQKDLGSIRGITVNGKPVQCCVPK